MVNYIASSSFVNANIRTIDKRKYNHAVFNGLRCLYCKKPLTILYTSSTGKVLTCSCFRYPYVDGILYLKRDSAASAAVKLIKQGEEDKILMTLIRPRFLLSIPIWLFLIKSIHIHFNYFLLLLRCFSYDWKWARYLTKRETDTSFILSVFCSKFIKSGDKVLDIGCGIGQLLPYYSTQTKAVYAIDNSPLSLLIARRFFADKKTILICSDIERGLPFRDGYLTITITTDVFQYLRRKFASLREVSRVLYNKGQLFIIHAISGKGVVYGNAHAIKTKSVDTMLKKLKFNTITIFPNSHDSFSVFAAKNNHTKNVWL